MSASVEYTQRGGKGDLYGEYGEAESLHSKANREVPAPLWSSYLHVISADIDTSVDVDTLDTRCWGCLLVGEESCPGEDLCPSYAHVGSSSPILAVF